RIQPSMPGIDVEVAADAAGASRPVSPADSNTVASSRLRRPRLARGLTAASFLRYPSPLRHGYGYLGVLADRAGPGPELMWNCCLPGTGWRNRRHAQPARQPGSLVLAHAATPCVPE